LIIVYQKKGLTIQCSYFARIGEKALKHSYYLITPGWCVEADEHMDQLVQSGEELRGPNTKLPDQIGRLFSLEKRRALLSGIPRFFSTTVRRCGQAGVEACHRVTSQAHRSSLALRHLLLFTNELAKTAETRSSSSSCVPCYCDSSPSAIRRRRGRPALNCCRSTTSPTPTSTISSSIA
jgi:hypothetical protein